MSNWLFMVYLVAFRPYQGESKNNFEIYHALFQVVLSFAVTMIFSPYSSVKIRYYGGYILVVYVLSIVTFEILYNFWKLSKKIKNFVAMRFARWK